MELHRIKQEQPFEIEVMEQITTSPSRRLDESTRETGTRSPSSSRFVTIKMEDPNDAYRLLKKEPSSINENSLAKVEIAKGTRLSLNIAKGKNRRV